MIFAVSNDIAVRDPVPALITWCRQNLVIDNPDYIKKQAMGKWAGNVPQKLYLYEIIGDTIHVPFGCLRKLYRQFPQAEWVNQIRAGKSVLYQSDINTYTYQENAIQAAIAAKNGILVMPCGAGKTQSGLEIISRLGMRALWLTHTQDLLNQSKKRAESVLRCGKFGTITAGKVNIGETITFATVQTMCKIDLAKYRDAFDIIICDECQHAAGSPTRVTQFYKVMSSLSARYKFGLTATPKRADGLEVAMFALIGDIIHEVPREAVANNTCEVRLQKVETEWFPDPDAIINPDGTIDYNKVIGAMIHDQSRFEIVINAIASLDGAAIVLANRIEYLQWLHEAYDGRSMCISGAGNSKAAKEDRRKALEALDSGKLDCLFATYQLAKEGLDVPHLRYVVFATPEKDETTVIQSVGRVGRKADDKDFGTVIDFVDNFGMYRGWAKKRERIYNKIGVKKD